MSEWPQTRKEEDWNIAALRLKFDPQLLRIQEVVGSPHARFEKQA